MSSSTIKLRQGSTAKRAGLTVALALAAMAALPAIASAATVSIGGNDIDYQAAAGETNSVVVDDPSTTYTFAETGILAGTGCTQGVNLVTCPDTGIDDVDMNMGDMGDTADATASAKADFLINGEAGNDTLALSADTDNNEDANGGLGNDFLYGGPAGEDDLDGEGGNDRMDGGLGSDPDDYDGGGPLDIDRVVYGILDPPGTLDFSYTCTAQLVSLDMDNDNDDTSCANIDKDEDNVRNSVESVTGSSLGDTITGSCFANTFSGDPPTADGSPENGSPGGNDTLTGDPGSCDDATTDGTEMDFFGGGEGSDSFNGDGTGNDGFDTVTYGFPYTYAAGENINVTIAGAADNDGWGNAAENVQNDIERVIGNTEDDTINATGYIPIAASGTEVGQAGVSLFGRAGDDILTDSTGLDTLNGEGNDTGSPGDTAICAVDGDFDTILNIETPDADCPS